MRKLWGAFVVIALVGPMVGISAGVAHANPPPVTFAPKTDFAAGDEPLSVAVADLNGDGVADMVVAAVDTDYVSVALGDGWGGFGPTSDFDTDGSPLSVTVADLNRDNVPDLVTANIEPDSVSVLLGDGHGGFEPKRDIATGAEGVAPRSVRGRGPERRWALGPGSRQHGRGRPSGQRVGAVRRRTRQLRAARRLRHGHRPVLDLGR